MVWLVEQPFSERFLPSFRLEWESGKEFSRDDYFRLFSNAGNIADKPLPSRIRITSRHEHLPDFLFASIGWIVSVEFRNLVEKMEPNIHRFVPVEVVMSSGVLAKKSYCYCFVGQLIASDQMISSADTSNAVLADRDGPQSWVVANPSSVGDKHLWRCTPASMLYFSNALKLAVDQAKLRQLRFTKIPEGVA